MCAHVQSKQNVLNPEQAIYQTLSNTKCYCMSAVKQCQMMIATCQILSATAWQLSDTVRDGLLLPSLQLSKIEPEYHTFTVYFPFHRVLEDYSNGT